MNIVDLRGPEAKSRALCGGKAAELAERIHDAMPVPGGFVVTTRAFASFLDARGLADTRDELRTAGPERGAELAAELRRHISEAAFPEELREEILDALRRFQRGGHLWAVRSSAIAEDTQTASFAGQYDTTLGVPASDVIDAIRCSWRSAFSERALEYRRARGVTQDDMAVVVQRMLRPDTAGVCFTVDPMGGEDRIVINANYGLGESVVSGHASPDTYVVARSSFAVISRTVGQKRTQVVAARDGVQTTEVSADRRASFCLSSEQAAEIAKLAAAVESRHDAPVDIEWAYETGRLFLLQARAITSTSTASAGPPVGWRPANNSEVDPRYPLYSNGNISEVLPGCITPLSWDHTGTIIEHAFQSQLEALGAVRPEPNLPRALGFFFHRPYVNVSLLMEAASKTPGMTPDTVREEFIGKTSHTARAWTMSDFMPHRWPRLVRVAGVVLARARSLPKDMKACMRTAEADAARVTDPWLADAPDQALLELVRMSHELAAPSVAHVWASTLASVAFAQLRRATARWLDDRSGALASSLVAGIENLPSAKPALALHALSEKIAAAEPLARVFQSVCSDADALDALREHPLHVELEEFLRNYGHRAVAEAELQRPCWREDPLQVVALVRNNLRPGAMRAVDARARQRRARKAAMAQVRTLIWWKRRRLTALTRRARNGLFNRETMKDLAIRRLDRSRLVYRELNRRLLARGLTATPDDIFFLTWSEVHALTTGTRRKEDIGRVIEARKRDYRWSRQVDVPKLQNGTPRILDPSEVPAGEELEGLGVSPGRITGVARIVSDPRSRAYIEPGEILVAPVTDVAWTPLFAQAAGLVVEVGGLLSHGSIVAREYGMPAVVGVAGATKTFRTGDRITLDGTAGRVFKLPEEERA
jgi:phosphohistidine swiveling domain-containing protein